MTRWTDRFLASTRGRVIRLLRREEASAQDLAGVLGLTPNAVRAHLATLERDGLVRQAGKRAGLRKPETLYALTPSAEQFFPKAYHLLLEALLEALGERMEAGEVEAMLREVGRRLGAARREAAPEEGLRARVERALGLLQDLGGLAEVEEHEGRFRICGRSCPLAAVAARQPSACVLAEALLEAFIGAPVRERCEPGEPPRCAFEVGAG